MALKAIIQSFDAGLRTELEQSIDLNNRVSFYSELQTDINKHPYYPKFRKELKILYNNSYKEDIFVNAYMGKNVPTIEISETIFAGLKDVFDSQNQNINTEISGQAQSEVKTRLMPYFDYFKNKGWDYVQTLFNSFLIMDINNETKEPYLYNVAPEYVKYFKLNDKDNLQEIIFSFDGKIFYYYTDVFYSVYEKYNNNYTEIITSPHNLERFPGNVFLNDKLNSYVKFLSKNIAVPQLDLLQMYVIKYTELYMTELATSNVTKVMPDKSCGYELNGSICKGGRLFHTNNDMDLGGLPVLTDDGQQALCPNCGHNRHIGTGAVLSVDFEKLAIAGIKVDDIIKYFIPPLEGTHYQAEKLNILKQTIINSSVGEIKKITAEARNEKDVTSDYESRTKILTNFGITYSKTIQDTFDVILRYWYNKAYKFNSVFLGNKFYLISKEELLNEKKQATNPIERSEIELKILAYDYKHDKLKFNAILEAYKIMPYSGMTDLEFLELIKLNKISDFDIELRTNINYYINRFIDKLKNDISNVETEFIRKTINPWVLEKININQNINNDVQS